MLLNSKEREEILKTEKQKAVEEASGFTKTASYLGGSNYQQPYPTPFLNLSDMQIPQTTIEILKWCKYFYTFDPLISGAINALATFPVSEIHLESCESKTNSDQEEEIALYNRIFHKTLDIYKLTIEIGIDYFLYGNCIVFGEMYTNPATKEKEWRRMMRLDPSKVIIDYNPATGEKRYKWQVPNKIRNIVMRKKPVDEYEKIPQVIKDAVVGNKAVILNPENVYHFSRATDSMGDNNIWGTPIVANVLKLLMYRNTLRQAQEAIAKEHIVPMRLFYLESNQNYSANHDWSAVAGNLAKEIMKSTRDPNYKVVSPVPVNMLSVGGNGRSLLLTPEIEQVQGEILAGMNVPREFIFGGVSYSGSSISLKILENQFITYRLLLKDFYQNFIIKSMEKARGEWTCDDDDKNMVTVRMLELKMQDDVQQKQIILQMNSAGKCSNDLLWKTMGIDAEKMTLAIEKEAQEAIELKTKTQKAQMESELELMDLQEKLEIKRLEMQARIQLAQISIQNQIQARTGVNPEDPQQQAENPQQQAQPGQGQQVESPQQQAQPTDQAEGQGGSSDEDIEAGISRVAAQIAKVPEAERDQFLQTIPEGVRGAVAQKVQELVSSSASGTDMRPMPEQRPPRRESMK